MEAERIRVLEVVNSMAPAGAERICVDLACALHEGEFDMSVACVRGGPLGDILSAAGVGLHVVGGEFDRRAVGSVVRLRSVIRELRPHIVHTHMIGSDIVGGLAAHLERVPVIISTQHDMYRRPPVFDLFRRYSARWLDAVVAVSPAMVGYCIRDRHMPVESIHIIENAVDVARFASLAGGGHQSPMFGAVGTLIPVKGHTTLMQAFARVHADVPDARLVIAGDGPEATALREQAAGLGIADAVRLAGWVSDVAESLPDIDILVHPSLQEGMPLSVIEGMAAGKPVIASDLPAIRRLLDSGRAGVLVPPGDTEALARAMSSLATDPVRARALAEAGRNRACAYYSLDRMAADYAALYRALLDAR
ncbi:MAG: glycosyltransferase [Coriobacteriia bacterium]|nr:glycosyltransferase [Coriobacteriia bacterium]